MKRLSCRQFLSTVSVTLFLLTPGCLCARTNGETETRDTNTNETAKPDTIATAKPDTIATAKPDTIATAKPDTTAKPATITTAKSDTIATAKPAAKSTARGETKTVTKSDSKAAAKPDAKTGNTVITVKLVRSLQAQEKIALLKEQHDILTMSIKSKKGDAKETALADEIVKRMQGVMSRDIAIKSDDDKCNVRVSVRPILSLVDQDDDYYRMNCSVDIEMKSADEKRLFGATRIELGAPRRVLEEENAVGSFAEPAATSSSEWCRKELNRIIDSEIGMTMISIQLPDEPEGKERNLQKDAASILKIGEALGKQKKILNYELISQDSKSGSCIYRVVYFTSEYPNGLINELNALFSAKKQN